MGGGEAMLEDATAHEVAVGLTQAAAFRLFTDGFGRWWPPEYSWSGDALAAIGLGPGEGAPCYEIGPHGFRCDWGRVLAWQPPGFVAFSWQIGADRTPQPDPARGSEVRVTFRPEGARTRVALVHSSFARHGESWRAYREEMGSPLGWPLLLSRYAQVAG